MIVMIVIARTICGDLPEVANFGRYLNLASGCLVAEPVLDQVREFSPELYMREEDVDLHCLKVDSEHGSMFRLANEV